MRKEIYGIGFFLAFLMLSAGLLGTYTIRRTNDSIHKLEEEIEILQASETVGTHTGKLPDSALYTFERYDEKTNTYQEEAYRMVSYSTDHVVLRQTNDENRRFLLRNENGYVTVYLEDGSTVFEYTAILVDNLPETIQEDVEKGKIMESSEALYSFLENYSS